MGCYFIRILYAYSGTTLMTTHNGVEKMHKRGPKMMEKMTKRRPNTTRKRVISGAPN